MSTKQRKPRKGGAIVPRGPRKSGNELLAGALAKRTDEELWAEANGQRRQFLGCMRKGIKEHARRAGDALLVLKSRSDGGWEEQVKANFKGTRRPHVSTCESRGCGRRSRRWAWTGRS
jgi:hypothetical protein